MAVIAVLVAVAIPTFGSQLEKARQATDVANLRDAYAIAKIAVLNQEDAEWSTSLTGTSPLKLYCNPDEGTLSTTQPSAQRKATTSKVIVGTEGLPSSIVYTDTVLSGADNKYIVVTFTQDSNGAWKGISVTFAKDLAADGSVDPTPSVTLKDETNKTVTGVVGGSTVTNGNVASLLTVTGFTSAKYKVTGTALSSHNLEISDAGVITVTDGQTIAVASTDTTNGDDLTITVYEADDDTVSATVTIKLKITTA